MDETTRKKAELWHDYLADAESLAKEAADNNIPPFQILLHDVKTGISQTLNCRYLGIGETPENGKQIVIVTPGFQIRLFDAMQFNYTFFK